ncbi:MAG: hypothetical protein JXQ29_02315, partial [Planctomycetes bacterium]|nr:hypothetical protein [Planctomycetota bacterium]
LYNCPVYRNQAHGRIGPADAYADRTCTAAARASAGALLGSFDASIECREVTCLYNHVNRWLDDLSAHPEKLDGLEGRPQPVSDFFL